ncbi:UNVERIFIED_CONTAM: hypothetical protein GTU68_014444 [Idotea baltica]|nr:hypothetical protein [Idotea baltica]
MELFKLAFYHKSNRKWVNGDRVINNERLEYLGDSILSSVVADYLYRKYPDGNEGFMTKMRSKIVKRKTLNRIGDQMSLDVLLNEFNETAISKSMLGNALEALVGAIYIERGYDYTHKYIVSKILKIYLDIHKLESTDDNYKSILLEWGQKHNKSIEFKLLAQYKAQKRDRFKIAVLVDGKSRGTADNFNKKSAEQEASARALDKLNI